MSYENMTVPQLRDEVRRVYTYEVDAKVSIPATSKLRKAELIELLKNAPRNVQVSATDEIARAAKAISVGMSGVPVAVRKIGTALHGMMAKFSAAERHDLDMAKYRGRYEGKRAQIRVKIGRSVQVVTGKIVSGTSRAGMLTNTLGTGTLVLTVRHDGIPRATLHRAEDVVLV